MYPICEPVEYASTFLISLFTIPCVASSNAVMAPVHAITSKNWSASIPAAPSAKNRGPIRATRNTPAFTIVAACMSAETAVGPVIASSSHSFSGNWADFPTAPPKSSTAAGTSRPWAAIEVAHVVSFKSSLNPNVPANANIKNIPASIMISPIFVMMNAFMPACVGE